MRAKTKERIEFLKLYCKVNDGGWVQDSKSGAYYVIQKCPRCGRTKKIKFSTFFRVFNLPECYWCVKRLKKDSGD